MQPTDLLHLTNADTSRYYGDVVSAKAIGTYLAPLLYERGYRTLLAGSSSRVYRFTDDGHERVKLPDLGAEAGRTAIVVLEAIDTDGQQGASRIAHTIAMLSSARDDGRIAWTRTLAQALADRIRPADDDERAAIERPPAEAEAAEVKRQADRDKWRARHLEVAERDTRAVLDRWLPTLSAGEHDLGAVWDAFTKATGASAKVAREHPGALAIGRNRFYAILAEVGDVRPGRSRSRHLHVPERASA